MKIRLVLATAALLTASEAPSFTFAATPATRSICRLASADAVSSAIHVAIVRVEPSEEDKNVCEYSIKGKPSSAATNHSISMIGAMNGQAMDPAAQKLMQGFGAAVLGGGDADSAKNVRHPGETAILAIDVEAGDAISQMKLNRQTLGSMQPVETINGVGDDAFATSQSMMFVRKGNTLLRITYTGCPCTSKDIEPLARQIVAAI